MQKENWATKDPMGRHVQESSRRTVVTNSQKPERMEYIHRTSVKATSLGTAHLVIKHSSSLWFHQEAVALMGLTRLIYLFIEYDELMGKTSSRYGENEECSLLHIT
jgi:hypothetical protein